MLFSEMLLGTQIVFFLQLSNLHGTSLSWDPALADGNKPCSRKSVKYGFVCVCNEKYCDSVPQEYPSGTDGAIQVESASDGTFMQVKQLQWNLTNEKKMQHDDIAGRVTLKILSGIRYQELVGFGGAFTDTTGANLGSIPAGLADLILRQYFEDDGARYTMARIPMASVDMSVRIYSYDDVDGDFNMTKFNLTKEDFDWKIPHIKQAAALVNSWAGNASWMAGRKYPLLLYGSPWSAPWWMKSTKRMQGPGVLIGGPSGPYWEAFAEYFVKFLANYKAEGVPLWGVTVTNEPTGAFAPGFPWQAMGMTAYMTRDFVKHNLGPKLHENGFEDVKIMVLDDQRFMVGSWADRIYTDPDASKYVSGMAVHWYWDSFTPPSGLSSVHKKYPDKFILASEACNGESVGTLMSKGVKLGDWQRAENFAHDIIQDLNHWVIGWVEWNLCLNQTGGPTWTENLLDSPIILNADQKEFYKQPTFYALAHFSAYIPPTSQVIHSKYVSWETVDIKDVDVLSVVRPDQKRVVVILNKHSAMSRTLSLSVQKRSGFHKRKRTGSGNSIPDSLFPVHDAATERGLEHDTQHGGRSQAKCAKLQVSSFNTGLSSAPYSHNCNSAPLTPTPQTPIENCGDIQTDFNFNSALFCPKKLIGQSGYVRLSDDFDGENCASAISLVDGSLARCQKLSPPEYNHLLTLTERLHQAESLLSTDFPDWKELSDSVLRSNLQLVRVDQTTECFAIWPSDGEKDDSLICLHSLVLKWAKARQANGTCGGLNESHAKSIFRQIVRLVAFCHELGIIVRDVRLRKFLVQRSVPAPRDPPRIHLCSSLDLHLLPCPKSPDTLPKGKRTACPAYVCPEIIGTPCGLVENVSNSDGAYAGKPADVWSLGVLLYVLLVGRYPFYDASPQRLFQKIRCAQFPTPAYCTQSRIIKPLLTTGALTLIGGILRANPKDRPTARDLLVTRWLKSNIGSMEQTMPDLPLSQTAMLVNSGRDCEPVRQGGMGDDAVVPQL